MSLQVIFLGTAGSVPTTTRSLPAIAVLREGELILFDCGEGTQRQMIKAGLGFNKRMKIFITHMHGDHMLGLPGLIQTMSLLHRTRKLKVYGPKKLRDFIETLATTVHFNVTFPVEIFEIKNAGLICEEREYEIHAAKADHMVPAYAYSFVEKPRWGKFNLEKAKALSIPEGPLWSKLQHGQTVELPSGATIRPEQVVGPPRPGRKITYTGDSRHSNSLSKLASKADILIHDCTFDDDLTERAMEDGHSTPGQATKTAKKAKVQRLLLTHISARYKTPSLLLRQAKKSFSRVEAAEDLMKIDLPLSPAR